MEEKETNLLETTQPANQVAGPQTCRNPRQNLPPTDKDKLAGEVPNEGSGTSTLTLAVSCAFTSAFATALFKDIYTDVDLQKATKLALELFI